MLYLCAIWIDTWHEGVSFGIHREDEKSPRMPSDCVSLAATKVVEKCSVRKLAKKSSMPGTPSLPYWIFLGWAEIQYLETSSVGWISEQCSDMVESSALLHPRDLSFSPASCNRLPVGNPPLIVYRNCEISSSIDFKSFGCIYSQRYRRVLEGETAHLDWAHGVVCTLTDSK